MPAAISLGERARALSFAKPAATTWFLAHAAAAQPRDAVQDCLAQLEMAPAEATLGFVYVTEQMAASFETALELLRLNRPGVNWVGATVPAVIAGQHHYQGTPAIVVMLATVPVDQFRILSGARSHLTGLIARLNGWRQRNGRCDAIIHGDANNPACSTMLSELARKLHTGRISGGMTASRREGLQVAVTVTSGGISGVMFGRSLALLNGQASGAAPIGLPHAITASRGRVVTELDHEPAFAVLRREAGELLARDPRRLARFVSPAVGPMAGEAPRWLQRRFSEFNLDDNSFRLDDLPAGLDCLRFFRRDPEAARGQFDSMLHRLRLAAEERPISAALLVSGEQRPGEVASLDWELSRVTAVFPGVPVIGYRGWGEFYNGARLGNSSVLTLITRSPSH